MQREVAFQAKHVACEVLGQTRKCLEGRKERSEAGIGMWWDEPPSAILAPHVGTGSSGKAVEVGSNTWAPVSTWEAYMCFQASGFWLVQLWPFLPFGREPADGTFPFSLSALPFCSFSSSPSSLYKIRSGDIPEYK